jgi:uncharacterized protein YodC (DUF2158 family)
MASGDVISPEQSNKVTWILRMNALKPGDLVVLKSGGPVMTVDTVNTDILDDDKVTGVLCAWFVGNKLERARFDCNAITPAPPWELSSGTVEPQAADAEGEHIAVLNEMMTAMNNPAEAPEGTGRAPSRRPSRTSRTTSSQTPERASAGEGAANATAPASRGKY